MTECLDPCHGEPAGRWRIFPTRRQDCRDGPGFGSKQWVKQAEIRVDLGWKKMRFRADLGGKTKLLRHEGGRICMTLQFFARVVELVDTQVSEACA